ncbi:hypothetical protein F0231_18015 [Vibrio sp. RE86]|uniref:hypothetical protein n=1 Tax=Vibrio sp. RE86 TaxID=2607605 RepID=UPI00149395BF|nr:hypothetical protein [Vibrio sp. RE86]NOH81635.1 hypothetical protein [Vibrio sp. RE86]
MKYINTTWLATSISLILASSASAAVPNTFSSGTPALASEVNENFSDLDTRVSDLENSATDAYTTVGVDCDDDSTALATALEDSRNTSTRTTYNITGTCDAVEITRNDVRIDGGGTASIAAFDDPDWDGESVFIDGQSNVRLQNLTLEGTVIARNNSNVRFENVVLPTGVPDGDEYVINVDIRTSYLRINGGSINNLALRASRNSTVDVKDSVTGSADQVMSDVNSSVVIDNDTVNLGIVEAIGSSFIFANAINASKVVSEGGSVVEADAMTVSGNIEAYGNSRLAVWGDASVTGEVLVSKNSSFSVSDGGGLTASTLECQFGSTFDIEGDVDLTGTFDWDNYISLNLHQSCHGQIGGTFNEYFGIDNHSTLIDGNWTTIDPPAIP